MNFYLIGNRAKVEELNEKKQEPIIADILTASTFSTEFFSTSINDSDLV